MYKQKKAVTEDKHVGFRAVGSMLPRTASVRLEQSEVCLPRDKGCCLSLTLSQQSGILATFYPSALLYFSVTFVSEGINVVEPSQLTQDCIHVSHQNTSRQ